MRWTPASRLLCVASATFAIAVFAGLLFAQELALGTDGRSAYEIVVPDEHPTPNIERWLDQSARVMQAAFETGGIEVPVVAESERSGDRPGIFLGNTAFAREHGVDVSQLVGWSYVHRAVGEDIIVAGRDHAPPTIPEDDPYLSAYVGRWNFDRVGTVKAVCDFLREYAGARFLYPDRGPQSAAIADSAGIEFLGQREIRVPADLDVHHTPLLTNNVGHWRWRWGFYEIANNMFPRVDDALIAHTWDMAVTPAEHFEEHPEWFAMIGGERRRINQYCLSNPGFQERVYQWTAQWLKLGFKSVNILQPDGFRPCQCEDCHSLYGTGDDWGEKIWIFNLRVAERLKEEGVEGYLAPIPYTVCARPPKSFDAFPDNVVIQFIGTNEEDLQEWSDIDVPAGITSGVHNWIANLGTRYTPMRTPLFLENQVRRFHRYNITSTFRDGLGTCFGLEGPAYYVWGRMFDDPAHSQASDLMLEFVEAAFGDAAAPMRRFYDRLHHGIELYANYLGTRNPAWTYQDIYGRRNKHLSDPFQMLGFLYTPSLLETLEDELAQAEQAAQTEKVRARLRLVRREFEYIRDLANVIHLYHAHRVAPDNRAIRDALLDAIDARNETIDGYYDEPRPAGWRPPKPLEGWEEVLFPPPGHSASHLRLEYNRYQEPFKETAVNWDTQAMRQAPLPGDKQLAVYAASVPLGMDSPQWERAAPAALEGLPGQPPPTRRTEVRTIYDQENLYVRFECELPASLMDAGNQDEDFDKRESVDVYLAPLPGEDIFYRFKTTPAGDRYDAASGLIDDPMNLLYGLDDPSWSGEWELETKLCREDQRWLAMFRIPFASMDAEPPEEDAAWRGNFGRVHVAAAGRIERAAWSVVGPAGVDDRNALQSLAFEPLSLRENLKGIRRDHGYDDIPKEWTRLPDPLPQQPEAWLFRTDPLEVGLRDGWHAKNADADGWAPMRVPAWYGETDFWPYHGYTWYRTVFRVPAEWAGRGARILFAGVDEQAWVYVNGHLAREHTVESEGRDVDELYDRVFAADIAPDRIEAGGENTLAVRVHSSRGQGGIWRPVFIVAAQD